MNKDDYKDAVKEAIREWLDAKFAEVGKWAVGGVVAMIVVSLLWLVLIKSGWTPPAGWGG